MTDLNPPSPVMPRDSEIEAFVAPLWRIASASPVSDTIQTMAHDSAMDVSALSRIVAQDPTLALRIIRAVNSAYFGVAEPVTNLERAIHLLGFETVMELAQSPSLARLCCVHVVGQEWANVRLHGLWQHALAAATAARLLAQRQGGDDELTAFAAGLVHDAGKVALLLLAPERYGDVLHEAMHERLPVIVVERRMLPFDHAQIGRNLCLQWGLPDAVALAVGRHHTVRSGGRFDAVSELAAIVHVADILARALGAGWWGDQVMPRLDPAARATLHLEAGDAGELLTALEDAFPRVERSMQQAFPPLRAQAEQFAPVYAMKRAGG